MKKIKNFIILLALLPALVAAQKKEIHILSANDMHANIQEFPQLAAITDSLRSLYPSLLVLSAGDNRTGEPLNDFYEIPAYPMVALMNQIGFDATALGNHEFDSGAQGLARLIGLSNFSYLCANIHPSPELGIHCRPCQVFDVDGVKVGIIGVVQRGENGIPDSHPLNCEGISFSPVKETVAQYQWLRDECDVVILLSHIGYEDDVDISKDLPWVDLIIGGHSHTQLKGGKMHNGLLITQNENRLKKVTHTTVVLEEESKSRCEVRGTRCEKQDARCEMRGERREMRGENLGTRCEVRGTRCKKQDAKCEGRCEGCKGRGTRIISKEAENIDVKGCSSKNELVQEMVNYFCKNPEFQRVLAQAEAPFSSEEELGCLMADAFREETGCDIGFVNAGGIRYETHPAGPFTVSDVFRLDPFGNDAVILELTGQELQQMLLACGNSDGHGFPKVSGIGCLITRDKEKPSRITKLELTDANGKKLDLKKTYKVVTNSYAAVVTKSPRKDNGHSINKQTAELIIQYLEHKKTVNYQGVKRVIDN